MLADSRLNVRQASKESRRKRESFSIESEIRARTSSSILLYWSVLVDESGPGSIAGTSNTSCDGFPCSGVPKK